MNRLLFLSFAFIALIMIVIVAAASGYLLIEQRIEIDQSKAENEKLRRENEELKTLEAVFREYAFQLKRNCELRKKQFNLTE